ncbi:hypothetical protein [Massilibacteroides vaginae]|uniref:hypothetical protein n=1 Tax=Massilibacteroides vaginae TaxID=1673718 RepID=UPI000A1CD4EC|nr:hypothetical protein [Massilibacteroides vaginae]
MKKIYISFLCALAVFSSVQCSSNPKDFKVQFDSNKEISGAKFALKDINPDLPTDWASYNYVVLEYKITTAQRFQLGFTTNTGYNELRIMSYVPNAWNKLAIPLKYFTELPDAAVDLAATFNHARYTGWVNLGGKRGPLQGVDSIGIRMRKPIDNPSIEIRSISLSVDDPGDTYMEDKPAVDEFGQSNLVEYKGKVNSLEQLKQEWATEEAEIIDKAAYNYSKYGGYKQKQIKATGFFRTEKIDGRWWFVDPEGYLFLSVGIDCVNNGGGGNVVNIDKRDGMFKELPPKELIEKYYPTRYRKENSTSYGMWNLYRRYGDDFNQKAIDMAIKRMDKWGLNTIANWSSRDVINTNQKAFLLPLSGLGIASDLMGLCDVYEPGFDAMINKSLKEFVEPYKNNPWLIGYFIGNEPAWLDEEGRLCSLILEGKERPIKAALQEHLKVNGDTPDSRKKFVFKTFRTFLTETNKVLKKYDPNHLNLGIRFGNILVLDEGILNICRDAFDVLSFNCYDLYPNTEMLDRALSITDLPMIIGEYHFGTVDRGMAQSLWQVDSQEERGVAYRYYTEKAYAHPGLIGTGYFQWCDQDLTGRGLDGENYNCGIIDVTDRPYKEQVEAMMETAKRLYEVHSGTLNPYNQAPQNARGHEAIPDLWNE